MAFLTKIFEWFGKSSPAPKPIDCVSGCVDDWGIGYVRGWARDADSPGEPLVVELCADGEPIARFRADDLRDDLVNHFGDEGRHGFSGFYELDAWRGRGRQLTVRIADRTHVLIGTAPGPLDQLAAFPPEKWSCLMNGLVEGRETGTATAVAS